MSAGHQAWRAVAVAGHCGGVGSISAVTAALVAGDPVTREVALGALDRLGALDDIVVQAALDDPDPHVRRRAATLAARRPQVALLHALADADASVVETAAWACGEQGAVDDAVLARLIEVAAAGAPLVREAAVAALGAIGDERGLASIVTACSDKPAVRRRAVLALSPFDGPAVEEAVRVALTDRDWQVRQAAEDIRRP